MGTPNVNRIVVAINHRFDGLRYEYNNCRHISSNPLRPWSQHAGSEPAEGWYGNAVDIFDPTDNYDSPLLDAVFAFLVMRKDLLSINNVIWKVQNHHNHIHVDPWPKMRDNWWYRPPCQGGRLVTILEDGSLSDTFATIDSEDIVLKPGDNDELVEWYQGLLNAWGADPVLILDGDYGAKTEAAAKWFQSTLGRPQSGVIDGPLATKLGPLSATDRAQNP